VPPREFALIGLGRFGSSVARTLFEAGHSVLGIDRNPARVQAMADHATHVVEADATDEDVLRSLGLRNFDVVVVSVGTHLEASVLITVMLKEMGCPYVVAKASSDIHGRVLQKVGADRVVFPERDMGIRLARSLSNDNVVDLIELTPEVSIIELEAGGQLLGRSLRDLDLRARYGVTVLAVRRGSQVVVPPAADEKFRPGDVLVLVGGNSGLERVQALAAG